MATRWDTFPVEFNGGLLSNMSPLQQGMTAPGSATRLQNFEPSKFGGYKKVRGYSKYRSFALGGSGKVLGLAVVSPTRVIVARNNGTGDTGYYWNDTSSWVNLTTAADLGGTVRSARFNFSTPKILFVDGVNPPALYDVTANTMSFPTLPSELTGGAFVAEFKNHIFIAKGSILYFSAPLDDSDWTSGSGGGVVNTSSQGITGLAVFRDQLIVFSKNQIQNLVGNSSADFQLLDITKDLGCIFPDTIQEVGGDLMFMGPDGLRLLSATERFGDFGLEVASDPINSTYKTFVGYSTIFNSTVSREKAQYRIFSYNPNLIARDSPGLLGTKFSDQGGQAFQWATLKGFKVSAIDSQYFEGVEYIIFANEDGYVYRMESGNSLDGAPIEAIYETPFMPITDPQKRKTIYKIALYANPEGSFSVDLSVKLDIFKVNNANLASNPPSIPLSSSSDGIAVWGDAVWGNFTWGLPPDRVYETLVMGSAKSFSVRIEDISTNPSFTLDSMMIEFKELDRL
jgi:hypothetical protein